MADGGSMAHESSPMPVRSEIRHVVTLDAGWEVASCAPDADFGLAEAGGVGPAAAGGVGPAASEGSGPAAAGGLGPAASEGPGPAASENLEWLPAQVPGTVAGALLAAGRWRPGEEIDLDARDWWFRTRFEAARANPGEEVALELDGIATVAEVYLNGVRLLHSEAMFHRHAVDVGGLLQEHNELSIRCRALAPLLQQARKPRARWRTRLVDGNLRFFRTMLLGRAPGFAPSPAAVGPWRPVRIVRRRVVAVEELALRPALEAGGNGEATGVLGVIAKLRPLDGGAIEAAEVELSGPSGTHRAALSLRPEGVCTVAQGMLRVPAVELWWPHTHGEPVLHDVRLEVKTERDTVGVDAPRTGFRALAAGVGPRHDVEVDGLDLHVNGVRVFVRGAVWTPVDPSGLAPQPAQLRAALQQVRDAGMNMLRIPGTSVYESESFHDLCDELGLLVWQDFMFANLDYPIADQGFRAAVEREAQEQLAVLGGRPSLAVLCGNSEIEQQVAMLGLDPALGRGELFGELLPTYIADAKLDAIYVPSAPCGGALPFRPDRGVANYYGVGGYRRPLEDARRAEVRFAAECLAFSNVPDEAGVQAVVPEQPAHAVVHSPRWKTGVPRDAGTGWDFEDVRDHYLKLMFGVDPGELRRVDHERYLELSRAVTGEAMAEVFGEWRRAASLCGGALVLWLADLMPGAGWGLVDHSGNPKPAYHHLRRALAPVAVWLTDEGLGGMRAHVANDHGKPLSANLRIALYRDGQQRVAQASTALQLAAHETVEHDFEALLGHFVDVSWAYRFGPPGHDVVVATLEGEQDGRGATADGDGTSVAGNEAGSDAGERRAVLSQAFRFPAGRPLRPLPAEELGLEGMLRPATGSPGAESGGEMSLLLSSRRLAYGVRVHLSGFRAEEDALTLEPGCAREIALRPDATSPRGKSPTAGESGETPISGALTALNLQGRVRIAVQQEEG